MSSLTSPAASPAERAGQGRAERASSGAHAGQGFPWFGSRCCSGFCPWSSTPTTVPRGPRADSLAGVSASSGGSCVSWQGSARSRFPACEHPDAAIPQNIYSLKKKVSIFLLKEGIGKQRSATAALPKHAAAVAISQPSGRPTARQPRRRAGPAAPRHQLRRHREVHPSDGQLQPPERRTKVEASPLPGETLRITQRSSAAHRRKNARLPDTASF